MSISHIAQFGGRIREEEKIVIIRREDNDKRESAPLVMGECFIWWCYIICDSSFNKTISTVAAIKAVLHLGSLWKNNRVNAKIHKGFGANIEK